MEEWPITELIGPFIAIIGQNLQRVLECNVLFFHTLEIVVSNLRHLTGEDEDEADYNSIT